LQEFDMTIHDSSMDGALANSLDDAALVAMAMGGESAALERLLRRHQQALYNLALYMLQVRADAEDATQEILVKITTGLSNYRGAAAFRTWAWRIGVNHLLDRRRSRAEQTVHGFACFEAYLVNAADAPLSHGNNEQERALLLEEAKHTCTMGMLLCLDRGQRLAFLLGDVLELEDVVAAEVLAITKVNFRQRLSRARRDLNEFLAGRCGLVNPDNGCRCARKTQAFIRDGIVDPANLLFAGAVTERARDDARSLRRHLEVLSHQVALELHALYPTYRAPDVAASVMRLMGRPEVDALLWSDATKVQP
jgi:RNA polymerase sigma factor (sigma-70 family)